MMEAQDRNGPLEGLRIVEFAGIGPIPFCGMLLADMGADVVRIDRASEIAQDGEASEHRGRRSIALDLKSDEGRRLALGLMAQADAVIEGFRPGVMERLGLGPEVALDLRPTLVYGRMSGWGQDGPLRNAAGHDINYIALSGALHAIGPQDAPVPPLNLVGDYGGGALHLAVGILSALLSARRTGRGQVVDCAMSDAAVSLMSMIYDRFAADDWNDRRAANVIDGGMPFYGTYRCSDGGWIAIGAIEPRFRAVLCQKAGIEAEEDLRHADADPERARAAFTRIFAQATRAEWCALLEGSDACFAPVLSLAEAPTHLHNAARATFVERGGQMRAAPAPRYSETPSRLRTGPCRTDEHRAEILADWQVAAWLDAGSCTGKQPVCMTGERVGDQASRSVTSSAWAAPQKHTAICPNALEV